MIHLKRFLWLAAWSVWIWLGVGLYRELPRDLGPVVCKLPLDELETTLGFLNGEERVVTHLGRTGDMATRYRCFDARSGTVLSDWRGPSFIAGGTSISLRHGVVFGPRSDPPPGTFDAMQLLNFRTGRWVSFRPMPFKIFDFHASKPLALGQLTKIGGTRIGVFNLDSGEKLAEWESETPRSDDLLEYVVSCRFIGDEDEFVVVVARDDFAGEQTRSTSFRVERRSISRGRLGPAVPIPRSMFEARVQVKGGRMAIAGFVETSLAIDVIDFRSRQVQFSIDASTEELSGPNSFWPQLSKSGRTILAGSGTLWSIDNGRRIWSHSRTYETVVEPGYADDFFSVTEEWKKLLANWGINYGETTVALRDLETGAVHCRVWKSLPYLDRVSSDGRLGVSPMGSVYSIPPGVNWPLLILCQSILALPLVLLWAVLRWRRKKKAIPAAAA